MRQIDADALMPLFIKKANTMKDRHGVKLGDEWLLNYNDIKDVIDSAPTVDIEPFASVSFNKEQLEQIVRDRVIEPIKNGELVIKEESEWIVDQSPSYTGLYMVSIDSLVTVANFDGKIFRSRNDVPLAIDAWRPLPEPYKEAENE